MLQIYHNYKHKEAVKTEWKTKTKSNHKVLISYDKSKSTFNSNLCLNTIFKKQIRKGLAMIIGGHYLTRNKLIKSNLICGIELNKNSNGFRLQKNIGNNECNHSYIFKGWYWFFNTLKVILKNDFTSGNKSSRLLASYRNPHHLFKLKTWIQKRNLFSFGVSMIFNKGLPHKYNQSNRNSSLSYIYTKAERTLSLIENSYPIIFNHNSVYYLTPNKIQYSFGYFKSIDGLGINIGYTNSHISINIPLLVLDPIGNNSTNKGVVTKVILSIAEIFLFQLLHYCTSCLNGAINNALIVNQINQQLRDYNDLIESRNKSKQIQQLLNQQAKEISAYQSSKEHYGLVIEYGLYGKKIILDRIIDQSSLTMAYINEILSDMNNEVIDITNSCIYLIKDNEHGASAYFDNIPSIIGFANPLLSNESNPYFLIKYHYNHIPYMRLYNSTESFIIPNDI